MADWEDLEDDDLVFAPKVVEETTHIRKLTLNEEEELSSEAPTTSGSAVPAPAEKNASKQKSYKVGGGAIRMEDEYMTALAALSDETRLFVAAFYGQLDVVKSTVEVKRVQVDMRVLGHMKDELETINSMHSQNAEVPLEIGDTALHVAARGGQPEVAQYLLDVKQVKEVHWLARNKRGKTAIDLATGETLELLRSRLPSPAERVKVVKV